MKNFIVLFLTILFLTNCSESFHISYSSDKGETIVGNNNLQTQTVAVDHFSDVIVTGTLDTEITIGDTQSITIEGDSNLIPIVKCESLNNTLTLSTTHNYRTKNKLKIKIVTPELFSITLQGSSNAVVTDLNAMTFRSIIRGSADLQVSGITGGLDIDISGSGDFDGENLKANKARITIKGSGDATVNVKTTLRVDISGSGDVTYIGSPAISESIKGSGKIKKKN